MEGHFKDDIAQLSQSSNSKAGDYPIDSAHGEFLNKKTEIDV